MISENDQNASLNAHECILFKLLKIKGVTKGYMHLLFQLDTEMSGNILHFYPKNHQGQCEVRCVVCCLIKS